MLVFVLAYMMVMYLIDDRVTTRFDEINASFGVSLEDFPIEIQRCLPMILSVIQKPVYIKEFMSVQCTREFLKRVTLHNHSRY